MDVNARALTGKKVTVMGIGLHGGGSGVIRFLAKEGADKLPWYFNAGNA